MSIILEITEYNLKMSSQLRDWEVWSKEDVTVSKLCSDFIITLCLRRLFSNAEN